MTTEKDIIKKETWNKLLNCRADFSKYIFECNRKWIEYLEKCHSNTKLLPVGEEKYKKIVKEFSENYSIYNELNDSIACSPVIFFSNFASDGHWLVYVPVVFNRFMYSKDVSGNKWGVHICFQRLGLMRNDCENPSTLVYSLQHAEKIDKNTFLIDLAFVHNQNIYGGYPVILKTFNDFERIDKSKAKHYIWKHHLYNDIFYKIYYSSEGYSIYMITNISESPIKERCIKSKLLDSSESENFKNAVSWMYEMRILPYVLNDAK